MEPNPATPPSSKGGAVFLYIDVTAGGALLQIAVGGAGTLAVSRLLHGRIRPARVSSESERGARTGPQGESSRGLTGRADRREQARVAVTRVGPP